MLLPAIVLAATAVVAVHPAQGQALGWTLPATTLSSSIPNTPFPQIAVAPDGTTTVVWSRDNGSKIIIQALTRPAAGSWPGLAAIEDLSNPSIDATSPRAAAGADGTIAVVWEEFAAGTSVVRAAVRSPGASSFGPSATLSPAGGLATNAAVAVGQNGAVTATWLSGSVGSRLVKASTRPAGGAWPAAGDAATLSDTESINDAPGIAMATDGTMTVAWVAGSSPNRVVKAATRQPGASWPAPAGVATVSQADATSPALLAVDPDGSVTAAWSRGTGASGVIQASTRATGGSWPAPGNATTVSGSYASLPALGIAPSGETTITWQRNDGSTTVVQASTRAPGGPWSAPAQATDISQSGLAITYNPQVAVAPDGATTAVWTRPVNNKIRVEASTRPAGGQWPDPSVTGSVTTLSASGANGEFPAVAVAADGTVTAAWRYDSPYVIQAASSAPTTYPLAVATAGSGSGTVTSSPVGITCGTICAGTFLLSTRVTLTATPSGGSSFTGWSGDCSGSSPTCPITVLGARAATATFTANTAPPNTAPSNAFTILRMRATRSSVTTRIRLPGPGRITQRGTFRASAPRTACTTSRAVRGAATVTLSCPLVAAARAARATSPLRVAMKTTFTPNGGTARTTMRAVTFSRAKARVVPAPGVTG